MTRTLRTVSAALLATLIAATPAYASFADWLDKLGEMSGPGPFIQRFGASVDVFCGEGEWWKDPQKGRMLISKEAVSANLEEEVLRALGPDRANNPVAITTALNNLTKQDAPRAPGPVAAPDGPGSTEKTLDALYASFREDTVTILTLRARTIWWEIREQSLRANKSSRQDVLQKVLEAHGLSDSQDPRLGLVKESFDTAFNFFCVGDMSRPHWSIGAYGAWLTTDTVPEAYQYPTNANASSRINAVPLAATFTTSLFPESHGRWLRSFDGGLAVGKFYFNGERVPDGTSLWFAEPRLSYRPLSVVACRKGRCPREWTTWDVLEVQGYVRILQGFSPADFGAESQLVSKKEAQWWFRVGLTVKLNRDQTPAQFKS